MYRGALPRRVKGQGLVSGLPERGGEVKILHVTPGAAKHPLPVAAHRDRGVPVGPPGSPPAGKVVDDITQAQQYRGVPGVCSRAGHITKKQYGRLCTLQQRLVINDEMLAEKSSFNSL